MFPFHRRLRFEPLEDRRLLSITVNTLVDEQDGSIVDGDVSLRDAIAVAASGETIDFSVTGTINLTGLGDLAINKNLTINGPGASLLTIRAFDPSAAVQDGRRVFNVTDGAATFKDVSISGLTLTGGDTNDQGGAIRNASENLTISACTVSGNAALSGGGITNSGGHLTIDGSTISGNSATSRAGGIETIGGTLSVTQSTISGNSALSGGGTGGGIHTSATTTTIDSSTISGNSALKGGGVYHSASGDGILMTITNSTISGNSARVNGGGVGVVYANLIVRHSTITLNRADSDNNATGNGGGIFVHSVLTNATIDQTIVAGNLRSVSTRDDISGAVVAASAFNLVGVNTGLTGISNETNGNQIGTGFSPINPMLRPLANNGGPTLTHAFSALGPALDAGDPAASAGVGNVPLNDQRGGAFGRVVDGDGAGGARIDIGAFEQQFPQTVNPVVDTLADENDLDFSAGDLSLREAIFLANGTPGAGIIEFASSLTSGGPVTIVLVSGEIAISDAVTISGQAGAVTVSGNNNSRIFNTSSAPAGTAIVLQGLTLTNGRAFNLDRGGAILVADEALIVQRCAITNSSAAEGGAIEVGQGSLLIEDSTLSGNTATGSGGDGGAIDVSIGVPVTIRRSTLSGNTAADSGGAIYFTANGSLTIQDSALSGNIANSTNGSRGGGAVYFFGTPTNFLISNSTLSGNSAPTASGGAICLPSFSGTAIVRNSTITGNSAGANGGGIARTGGTGIVSLSNTIVAGNTNANSPDLSFDAASNVAGNNNLVGVANVGNFTLTGTGNQTGTQTAPLDAKLGLLANNGGPTKTHALLTGSPVIDAGDPAAVAGSGTVPLNDQRGARFARVFDGDGAGGARIDIGAYERQAMNLVVDTLVDENDGNYAAGDLSLREAIGLANANIGIPDTITFIAALTSSGPGVIVLTLGEVDIVDSVSITGPAASLLTLAAFDPTPATKNHDGNRVFRIDDSNTSTLIDVDIFALTLTGGDPLASDGGAIASFESLAITACTITDNAASTHGGAIFQSSGNLTIDESTISGNRSFQGGGLYMTGGSLTIANSTISGNTAGVSSSAGGGGIWCNEAATIAITGSMISGNTAMRKGGGIAVYSSPLTLNHSTISGNTVLGTTGDGGGIYIFAGSLMVNDSTIIGNTVGRFGGGISAIAGSLSVAGSTISGNSAKAAGGIESDGYLGTTQTTTIFNSTISGNTATGFSGVFGGGGLYSGRSITIIRHSTITNNSAPAGLGSGIQSARSNNETQVAFSIIAGNTNSDVDLVGSGSANSFQSNGYNLIGSGNATGEFVEPGDQIGVTNPVLGSLADNGGPTKTHALLLGSPAIDEGDPNFNPADPDGNPLTDDAVPYDQRGAPFNRVFDGNSNDSARIDIGAYELQPKSVLGDYNLNGTVDAADYVVWRKTLGTSDTPPFIGADGDGDSSVDPGDHGVWRAHFGQTLPPPGSGAGEASSVQIQELRSDTPAERNIDADYLGKTVVQIPMETISAPAETDAAAARSAGIAALETRSLWHDSSTRSRRTIHRYQVAESGGDDLPLLLAIDRVRRSPPQDSFVSDDNANGEHRADNDDSESEINEPLAVALAVWREARSPCILPG